MTVTINVDAEIDGVRLVDQGSHPASPNAGHTLLYIVSGTTNGGLFVKNSSGQVIGPFITGTAAVSSGVTQEYAGYNVTGTSAENMGSNRIYTKRITLSNACLLSSIDAFVDEGQASDQVRSLSVALYTDNGGTPGALLLATQSRQTSLILDSVNGAGGNLTGRWFSTPVGSWLAAGSYWISIAMLDTAGGLRLFYNAGGSDIYYDSGGAWFTDWGFYSQSSGTNNYSIRANTIR